MNPVVDKPAARPSGPNITLHIALGMAVTLGAFFLFFVNNDFPLGLHLNEQRKVDEIITGHYYFLHPLFLPLATKCLAALLGANMPMDIAILGRTLSAALAAIGVSCAYVLAGKRVGPWIAAIAAIAMAATPMLAVHAHYLKEDASLFGFCALSVLCADALARKIDTAAILAAGICLGLAAATKLVGAFLAPVFIIAACFGPRGRRLRVLLALIPVILLAILVLAAINQPVTLAPAAAGGDFRFSFEMALQGKNGLCCVYHPAANYLTDVVRPDLGWPLFILAGAAFVNAVWRWRRATHLDRLLLVYAVVYHAMIEISPYRDWPDLSRTSMPLLLPLMYFTALFVTDTGAWITARWPQNKKLARAGLYAIFLLAAALPAYDAVRLVAGLRYDTREDLGQMMRDKTATAFYEDQALPFHQTDDEIGAFENNDFRQFLKSPHRFLVLSSFVYDKFAFAMRHENENVPLVRDTSASFEALFQYPYCEIRPRWRTYAYSNPTLRVFDLDLARQGRKADPATNGQICDTKTFN